jgi:23S rRNA (guanosine2251-2'-O)-methyltransferase
LREGYEESATLVSIAELASAMDAGIRIMSRTQGQLDGLGSGHQGVALMSVENPEINWEGLAEPGKKTLLILDGIEDPHNLGSMLRTAWLTGVSGVLIPEDRAVGLTPTVCKIASGGAEHVPVESFVNLASIMQKLKDVGFWVYGLSEKGERKPWEFSLPDKVAWVVGSEGAGMRITTERACDEVVRIPQVASGSSYNAAVVAAMVLMETCRQSGKPS